MAAGAMVNDVATVVRRAEPVETEVFKMKEILWTIQHEDAYREFERTGVLRANEDYLFCEDDFRFAYDWLVKEMRRRIGEPPMGVKYPVWAWYQWEGKRKRHDLRRSGHALRGTPLVQIEFEIDTKDFLLSDFDVWHDILAKQYIAYTQEEWDRFYETHPRPAQADVEHTWDRVFDIHYDGNDWHSTPENRSIQATLWQIEISQVKTVQHFLAK